MLDRSLKLVRGIKRPVLPCSLGFVPAVLATTANAHDTQPVGALLDRAAEDGWSISAPRRTASMAVRALRRQPRNTDWTSRSRRARRGVKGLPPLPLRWRIEATFGTLSNRWHRLTRNLEQSPTAAEDAISIACCHRLLRA